MLLLDKPAGITSHAVVQAVRRIMGLRRIGHTGTLDPFATGLLLLCVGGFTRAIEYFHALPKRYSATMRLGQQMDTDDRTGRVIRASESWRDLAENEIVAAVAARVGRGDQVPSTFSAKKIGGVRAYTEARAGRAVALAPVPIVVYGARISRLALPDVDLEVTVSTGTYIRALARDIGHDLGCGAHLAELRRVGIGPFQVEDACDLETLDAASGERRPGWWRDAVSALNWLPRRDLTAAERTELEHGRAIELGVVRAAPLRSRLDSPVALVRGDSLVAIGTTEGDRLRPRKVFPR